MFKITSFLLSGRALLEYHKPQCNMPPSSDRTICQDSFNHNSNLQCYSTASNRFLNILPT